MGRDGWGIGVVYHVPCATQRSNVSARANVVMTRKRTLVLSELSCLTGVIKNHTSQLLTVFKNFITNLSKLNQQETRNRMSVVVEKSSVFLFLLFVPFKQIYFLTFRIVCKVNGMCVTNIDSLAHAWCVTTVLFSAVAYVRKQVSFKNGFYFFRSRFWGQVLKYISHGNKFCDNKKLDDWCWN